MHYKNYGKTGKKVSVLGFGAMRFDPVDDEENAIRTIHRAADAGINYFDTAPGYCNDNSETYLGNALALLPQDRQQNIFISTKSSIQNEPTADDVRRKIDDQLHKLQRRTITFYHMWCIMDLDHYQRVMAPGGPYEGVLKAYNEGLVEHIVFSTHARGDEIATMVRDGAFEGVTMGYNILNHRLRIEGIRRASENSMGVVVMNPLGGGMLCQSEKKLGFLREHESDSFIAAALRFVLAQKEPTVTLAGMGNPDHVDFNVGVAESIAEPDEKIVQTIIEKFDRLGEKFCTACRYCLEHCPEKIQIHLYMNLWDRIRMEIPETAKNAYQFYTSGDWFKGKQARDCQNCNECEEYCTQHLPISEYLARCADYFGENEIPKNHSNNDMDAGI